MSGLPLLRQYELEDIASALIYAFDKSLLKAPRPVDAERFAEYLGLRIRCERIDDVPYRLCFVAFEDQALSAAAGKLPLRRGELVIESALVESCDMALYRYALMHGCAHWYLHSTDEEDSGGQLSFDLSGVTGTKNCLCCVEDIVNSLELNEREGQADYFAQCLLMPKNNFKLSAVRCMNDSGINRADLSGGELDFLIDRLAELFGVPKVFVLLRLRRLNFI